jgi:hypothetical protein
MEKQTYSIDVNDKVLLKAYGNLVIRGWDSPELGIKAGKHELKIAREENQVSISAMGNCEIWLPVGVEVLVDRVGGWASVHDQAGGVRIMRVGGDLTLENVGAVTVEKIGGRLAARKLTSLSLDKVGGRCVVEEASGGVTIGKVGGDCFIKGVAEAKVDKAGGDVDLQCLTLSGSTAAGGDINISFDSVAESGSIKAGGDIRLYLPGGVKINLDITANSEDIRITLGDLDLQIEEETYFHSMGDDLPTIKIMAGGDVRVTDKEWTPVSSAESFDRDEIGIDWEFTEIGDMVSRTVEAAVSQSTRFADLGARIGEKAARKGEAAARKAERKIEKMMRSMNIEDRQRGQDWSAPRPPVPPEPPAPPRSGISEEERVAVLQMLQEKKISLEEAERLLDALDSYSE